MILQMYVVGALQANCYVVGDEQTREVLVIDPGDDAERLLEQLRERELRVTGVFATHSHLDHTGGVHELLEALPEARFYMHRLDYPQIAAQRSGARALMGREVSAPREPDRYLEHGDEISAGRHTFTALHCPGHTAGSLCLYGVHDAEDGGDGGDGGGRGVVFTGDVLFAGSVGRSDFPGGDGAQLIASIRQQLLTLPDATTVLPGHNMATTISAEREHNPFLA